MAKGVNFPKIGDKGSSVSVFSSEDAVRVTDKKKLSSMPKKVVITYSSFLENRLKKGLSMTRYSLPFKSPFYHYIKPSVHINQARSFLMFRISIGAPATAIIAEDLVTMGVNTFLILGSAGGIGKGLSIGDLSLCTRALRDEGTSHHYIKDSLFVDADRGLVSGLGKKMRDNRIKFKEGGTWSTDAIYAESKKEINTYSKMGILTVEMEAAALFAVAKKRGVKASGVFTISDLLNGQEWTGMKEHELENGFSNLVKVCSMYGKFR